MKPTAKMELLEKGWSKEEIAKVEESLQWATQHDVHFSKIVFWSSLVVVIIANIILSLILIPFLIVLNKGVLFTLVIILGGTIGFIYNFLITDIGHLPKKHHIMAGIIIPFLALANMVVVVVVSNRFIADLQVKNAPHNPFTVAVVFAIAFIIPYVIDSIRLSLQKRKAMVMQ